MIRNRLVLAAIALASAGCATSLEDEAFKPTDPARLEASEACGKEIAANHPEATRDFDAFARRHNECMARRGY